MAKRKQRKKMGQRAKITVEHLTNWKPSLAGLSTSSPGSLGGSLLSSITSPEMTPVGHFLQYLPPELINRDDL